MRLAIKVSVIVGLFIVSSAVVPLSSFLTMEGSAGPTYWTTDGPTRYTLYTMDFGTASYSSDEYRSAPTSINLKTIVANDRAEIVFENGPQLKDIDELSYWAYTEKTSFGDFFGGILRPYLAIYLHEDSGKDLDDWISDAFSGSDKVYYIQAEPFYADPMGLSLQTWETWDAFDSYNLRWVGFESPDLPFDGPALEDYIDGTATDFPTSYSGNQAFASREYGNLYVVAIKVRAGYGGSWTNFEAYVDDVTINDYDEDFGPAEADIDIKPGSCPNSINLKSKGKVPVAILTTSDFDATDVDPSTVEFAGAAPVKWSKKDVDKDGDKDLVFHFKTQELDLVKGDTEATLTGQTTDGTPITGTDSVRIVPPK
ncbi:MAG: hypothetical protein KAQ96_00815 [Thermoplasmata archaeon]|nr:hypothetical protein [Thermoplasmata archaeon]